MDVFSKPAATSRATQLNPRLVPRRQNVLTLQKHVRLEVQSLHYKSTSLASLCISTVLPRQRFCSAQIP